MEKWFRPTIDKIFKKVDEEEFKLFLRNYPRKLERDFFMDQYTFNDFDLSNRWPYSIVAIVICGMYGDPDEFEICENIFEVVESVKYFDSEEDMNRIDIKSGKEDVSDAIVFSRIIVPFDDLLMSEIGDGHIITLTERKED